MKKSTSVLLKVSATAALLVMILSLSGCANACACVSLPTPAPGAISEEAAVAAAKQNAPPSVDEPSVIWAHVALNPFEPRAGEVPLVWEVRLQGGLALSSCAPGFLDRYPTPSDPSCLDRDGGLVVVLDQFTGKFLGWAH
jgi:hypothetical protein